MRLTCPAAEDNSCHRTKKETRNSSARWRARMTAESTPTIHVDRRNPMNNCRRRRHIPPTDLVALHRKVLARGPEAALPQILSVPASLFAHTTHTDCTRSLRMHTFCPPNAHGLHLAPHCFDGSNVLGPTFRNVAPLFAPGMYPFCARTLAGPALCTRNPDLKPERKG